MKLLSLPVPIIVAILLPQTDVPGAGFSPGTAGSLVLATVALLLWFLNAIGKLPGGGSNRRKESFTEADRERMEDIHENSKKVAELLGYRDDDGLERYLLHAKQSRETATNLAAAAITLENVCRHLEVIAENSVRRG